ncbi:hypothetical protein [Mariprofundus sp. EBB-1]|uniref:hypothetical protein n=1 Tax=Mariprofundus sp. EBB-1 TaxID=2650971 RepID=UPI0011C3509C|nr:hypothetical protein [Mariprofundus sp. EBB-1]
MTSSVEKLDDITRIRLGDQLGRQFHEEKPNIKVIRTGLLAKEVGNVSLMTLLDSYRVAGAINSQDVEDVRHAVPSARYLVLSRIEQDHISEKSNQTESNLADSEQDKKKGEYEQVRVDVSLETTHEMGVSLTIYDLQQNLHVWSGYVSKTKTNSNDSSRTFSKDKRWREELVDAFVDTLIGLDQSGYPEPPTQTEVLDDIFKGFVENMPESTKK